MNTTENFIVATAHMVNDLSKKIYVDDPGAFAGLERMFRDGAILKLEAAFSAAGFLDCRVTMIGPNGELIELGELDIEIERNH